MPIEITLSGSIDDIVVSMTDFMDRFDNKLLATNEESVFKNLPLQDLLAHVGKRLEEEDYEFTAVKRIKPQAERKREDARAKLRGDLEASLAELEPEKELVLTKVSETELRVDPKPAKAKAKATTNGSEDLGDPAKIKANCLIKLKELYNSGRKIEVNKILAEHGGGAKNFSSVPDVNFIEIMKQVEALG